MPDNDNDKRETLDTGEHQKENENDPTQDEIWGPGGLVAKLREEQIKYPHTIAGKRTSKIAENVIKANDIGLGPSIDLNRPWWFSARGDVDEMDHWHHRRKRKRKKRNG